MAKKELVKNMFNNISGTYDKLNHILSLGIDKIWRKRAITHLLEDNKEQEFLDLACGTGDFAISLAKYLKAKGLSSSHITAVDISEGMLEIMRKKVEAQNLSSIISSQLGDGERLMFPKDNFDAVSIAFGIRNFENRKQGLSEIHRVLKSQGKLVILELSEPSNRLIRFLYKLYFKKILPTIGKIISGDSKAYSYLPDSVEKFPKKEVFIEELKQASFSKVIHKSFSFGICRLYIAIK